jgi:hypothetical protein
MLTVEDTPPDVGLNLFREEGPEPEHDDPDFLGLEPVTVDEPPPTGWRRVLVSGAVALTVVAALITALVLGTTGDQDADRVAQPVPADPPRAAAPTPAPTPAPTSAPTPSPVPQADEPAERAAPAPAPRPDPPRADPPRADPAPADVAERPDEQPVDLFRDGGDALEDLAEAAAQRRLDRFRTFVDRVDEFWGIDR